MCPWKSEEGLESLGTKVSYEPPCVYAHAQLLTKGPFLVSQFSLLLWVVDSQAGGRELDCVKTETLVCAAKLAWPLLSGSSKRKLGAG